MVLNKDKYNEIQNSTLILKDKKTFNNIKQLIEETQKIKKNKFFSQKELESFIQEEFIGLIEQAENNLDIENLKNLREFLKKYKENGGPIQEQIDSFHEKCEIELYEKLSKEKLKIRDRKSSEKFPKNYQN